MSAFAIGLPVTAPFDWAKDLVGDVAMAPVNMLANAVASALQTMVKTLSTAWIKIDTPNLASPDGHASATVAFLQGQLVYVVGFCAVMALVIGGARLAWEGRHEPAQDVLRGLMTLAVVSACGLAAIGLLVSGSDQLAEHIIDVSTQGNGFGKNLSTLLALSGSMAPFLVVVLGVLALLVSLVQVGLIVFRAAALVMLAGFLPLAASFTSTPTGRQWFKRYTGWAIALVAYKPTAALCYAAAFQLLGSREFNADGVLSVLVGLALMTMAVVALPALLKFLAPAVQAISLGGGGGGGRGAVMAASLAMPMGARMIAAGAGAGGAAMAAGGGGGRGPSGAGSAGPAGGAGSPGPAGGGGPSGTPGASGGGTSGAPGAPGAPGVPGDSGAPGSRGAGTNGRSGPAGAPGAATPPPPPDRGGAATPRDHPDGQDGPDGSQRKL